MNQQDFALLSQLEKHKSRVLRLAKRQCNYYGNRYDEPEDLYQDVFMKCWSCYRDGKVDWQGQDNTGLIVEIAQNYCRSARRKTVRHCQQQLDFEPPDHIEFQQPDQIAMANERDARVSEAMSALPPSQHSAIEKRFYEGMKPQEIASESEDKITTIYKRLDRAKHAIAQHCLSSDWLNVM